MHGSYDKISPNNGELLINGIDKGTAVRDVASLLGYAIADTIAIGDSDNDTAMLKAAGTSVAMGNAIHASRLLRHHYHRHPRQRSSQRLQDIGAGVTSAKSLPVAIAQFTVAEEPERNLEIIDGFARDAAAGGAKLLALPEG